nr:A24 family peptidase [Ornithinimicrobium sp. HY1745]
MVIALSCICLAAMDFDVHRLPDRLMWPSMGMLLLGLAIAGVVASEWGAIARVVLAGLTCGAAYLALALLSLARGSLAVGLGDVKLAALLGMGLGWFGWQTVLVGMYAGFLVGGLYAVYLLVTRKVGRSGELAYGPPMMVGALIGVLVGPGALTALF